MNINEEIEQAKKELETAQEYYNALMNKKECLDRNHCDSLMLLSSVQDAIGFLCRSL